MSDNDHDDIVSAVRASVDQLAKSEPDAGSASEPTEPSEDTTAAPESRARDPETGRFVASEEKPAEARPAKPQAAEEAVAAPEPAPSTAPALKPPTSWPTEAKTEFAKLSPAVQQAVLKREAEMESGRQQYSNERQRLQAIDQVIAPRRQEFQRMGIGNDAEAINHLLGFSDMYRDDPVRLLIGLARNKGIDLNQLAGIAAQQPQQPQQPQQQIQPQQFYPPDISRMVQEAIDMKVARDTVEEFEANPPEHYQEVKPLMQMLLHGGQAKDLRDAYDKAVWMNPDIRSRMIEAQRVEQNRQNQQAQAAKVAAKAKAANASLTGAPNGSPSTAPPRQGKGKLGDVTDDVRAAVAALM